MQARYTTEDDSYYGQWLHLYRTSGTLSRFPVYDNIGSARGLLDASGTATDWYELDTFGRQASSSGTTPNPYRFGAGWGYITDPSGFLQVGQRFYWPEVGRFVSRDPVKDEINSYAYVSNRPVSGVDPTGRSLWCYLLCAPLIVLAPALYPACVESCDATQTICEVSKSPDEMRDKQKKRYGKCWAMAKKDDPEGCEDCCMGSFVTQWDIGACCAGCQNEGNPPGT